MHLSTLIFDAWRQVVKSRESILLDLYLKSATDCGVNLDGADNLAEARRLFFERAKIDVPPTPQVTDLRESRWVICTRISAWWLVMWSNIIPGLLIGYLVIARLISYPHRDVLSIALTLILAIPMFFVAAVISLCLSALLARPFTAMMNWLFPADEIG
jgi:hypothetical protein